MIERVFIALLAVAGALIAASFSSVYHKLALPISRAIPRFCRLESKTCQSIVDTPQARLFGIPNSDLGILYYLGMFGSSLQSTTWAQLHWMLAGASAVTLVTGFYLTYVLVFRLRTPCMLCFISHAVNFLIFLLLLTGL